MLKIAVAGAAGRMGRMILAAAQAHADIEAAAAFEAPGHPAVGKTLSETCGLPGSEVRIADEASAALEAAQVLIDFTAPQATLRNLAAVAKANKANKAAVVGTTGLNPEQLKELAKLAKKIPLVFAPNMSVGMNLMFKLAGQMARVLGPGYALEVLEAHHDQKKDAPSGTAVKLISELAAARGWEADEVCAHGRKGLVGARPAQEIGVSVIRGGDIVGDHTVYFIGQGERLELTHRAHSRETFVQGALRAALWVADKAPGLYDMQDVLGLKG